MTGQKEQTSWSTSKNTGIDRHTWVYWEDEDENAAEDVFLHKDGHAITVLSRRAQSLGIIHSAHLGIGRGTKQPKVFYFTQTERCHRWPRVKSSLVPSKCWSEVSCEMHWCKYTKHTHCNCVTSLCLWNSDWSIFVSVPWKRSPLAEGLLPPEFGLTQHWQGWCLFIDQNGLSNSFFCLSNWVAGWRWSSNGITLYKSYLFGVGFLMG